MSTRKHDMEIALAADPQRVFSLLVTPSAIRQWWGAARAIVLPHNGGIWAAVWGADEDRPDYVTACRIQTYDPPRRLVLSNYSYFAKEGPLPFSADFIVEFTVQPTSAGCILRVVQDGFPVEPIADAFYAGCEVGWRNTFECIRQFLFK